jgi:N6-L-threonylcarbamoyladenine synthase
MTRILGIDTSNYTTSAAVVQDGAVICSKRKMLNVKLGEKGLRQSEALFQHVNNLPLILLDEAFRDFDAVCVSSRPRPVEGSYMPVFKAGEGTAVSIASVLGIPVYKTSHQEGHIKAACYSAGFDEKKFIAFHLSGGTSEILLVSKEDTYNIEIIGGTRDISFGQFIDRIGVSCGMTFPSGKQVDDMAVKCQGSSLRIPSRVDGLFFNLSGQETAGLRYVKDGYNQEEISYAVMLCVSKTLEKLLNNLCNIYNLPVIITGGVSSSSFIKNYLCGKYNNVYFSTPDFASDNAAGVALIGCEMHSRSMKQTVL